MIIENGERAIIETKIRAELEKEKLSSKELIERIGKNLTESLKIRKVLKYMTLYGDVVSEGNKISTKYKLIDVEYEDNNL